MLQNCERCIYRAALDVYSGESMKEKRTSILIHSPSAKTNENLNIFSVF